MKALKIWGWLLFVTAVALSSYGWISGEFNGHGIASMDNVESDAHNLFHRLRPACNYSISCCAGNKSIKEQYVNPI